MSTARPVMRTLQYPGRSWWQLGAAGVGDGEKQMSLRDSLGGKMKVWEPHPMPCSCICSSEPTHCSEVSFHILSGSFPDMPGQMIIRPRGGNESILSAEYWSPAVYQGFPCGSAGKKIPLQSGRPGFYPWIGKIPWQGERLRTPV